MQHKATAVDHFGDKHHRELLWRTFIKWQQAYTSICKDISAGSANRLVAYGDASFCSCCCKGNPSHQLFLCAEMGYHCKVFDMYEFRTSRLCCAAMDGMPLPVTGNPSPYQRADMQTPHKPRLHMLQGLYTKHMVTALHTQYLTSQPTNLFGYTAYLQPLIQHKHRTSITHTTVSRKTGTAPTCVTAAHQQAESAQCFPSERGRREYAPENYSVRLCRNTECHRTLWNRDVNAAIIIPRLFLDWAKPPEFCRDAHCTGDVNVLLLACCSVRQ